MPSRIIRWIRQWGSDDKIAWVIVAKLDVAWKLAEPDDYIAPQWGFSYGRVGEWICHSPRKIPMPHICLYKEGISFTDGRHRFSWCRDHGIKALPVTASPDEARIIAKRYGSKARQCRLPAVST